MNLYDKILNKSIDEVYEDYKEMEFDELADELEGKLEELDECNEYEDQWLSNHDEDALDSGYCENAGDIAELEDEISDIVVVMKEKYNDDFENKFSDLSDTISEEERYI